MTEDEWIAAHRPLPAPTSGAGFDFGHGDTLLAPYASDTASVLERTPDERIWTVMDGDEGETVVVAGFHHVNRIGHIVTEEPWSDASLEITLD